MARDNDNENKNKKTLTAVLSYILGIAAFAAMLGSQLAPSPLNAILSFFSLAIFFCWIIWGFVKSYLADRQETIPKSEEQTYEEERLLQEIEAEDKEYKEKYSIGSKCVILCDSIFKGTYYQCIKGENAYYFRKVGGSMRGIKGELIITDFSDETTYFAGTKGYSIKKQNITDIKYTKKEFKRNLYVPSEGMLEIKGKRKKRFSPIGCYSKDELEQFFDNTAFSYIEVSTKNKEAVIDSGISLTKITRLRFVNLILTLTAITLTFSFLFAGFNYIVNSLLLILIVLTAFVLYIVFNDVYSMSDINRKRQADGPRKVSIIPSIFAALAGLGLRSLLDLDFLEYSRFLIISAITFAVFAGLLLFLSKETRKHKSAIFVIITIMVFFAPSATAQINLTLDFSEPKQVYSEVYDKEIVSGSNTPTEYLITVEINGKREELDVSKEYYDYLTIGDTVTINIFKGALGIPCAFVSHKEFESNHNKN